MKFLRFLTISCLAFVAFSFVSCKDKDDDSSTKEYLSGNITFDVPSYLQDGVVVHVVPTGVYRGEDQADTLLAFSWSDPFTGITDTLRLEGEPAGKSKEFDLVVPKDTIGSFSLVVNAWADGYYVKTTTLTFIVVNPTLGTGSLKGYDFLAALSSITDARDNQKYYYNTVAGKDWMIQNLAWDGSGIAYGEAEAMSPIFGRFYTWTEANAACPSGWHLPSSAEFKALAEAGGSTEDQAAGSMMVDASFNGDKMWEFWPDVKITNTSRFSAIPVGYAVIENDKANFKSVNKYAMFWTSDSIDADMAVARYIYEDKPVLFGGEFGKESIRASVRCVR